MINRLDVQVRITDHPPSTGRIVISPPYENRRVHRRAIRGVSRHLRGFRRFQYDDLRLIPRERNVGVSKLGESDGVMSRLGDVDG